MMRNDCERKVLFFDVDGTLVDEAGKDIPESTVKALVKAMEKGHLVFVNSGRARCMLKFLEETLPADGFLCGCGTQIVVKGESRFHRTLSRERGEEIKKLLSDCRLAAWLEGEGGVWFPDDEPRTERTRRMRENMMRDYGMVPGWGGPEVVFDKFCALDEGGCDLERFFAGIPDMDVIDRGDGMYECVPSDCTKATAMDWVLKEYGLPLESAYVFGDSTNDISMFAFAPNRIAMGVHAPELEKFHPFITKTVEEGGVAWAMEQLGII